MDVLTIPLPALLGAAALLLALAAFLARRAAAAASGVPAGKAAPAALALDATASSDVDTKAAVTILFGTQTGTAERFARALKSEIAALTSGRVDVVDAEEYAGETRLPSESLVLFLMATYGDGEPTDNAADLYNWIVRSAGDAEFAATKPLAGVSYGVFGLGNKQYEHFCAVGKRLHKALDGLGGAAVVPRGDGDDDDDIEGDFDAWKAALLDALRARPDLLGDTAAAETTTTTTAAPLPAFTVTPAAGPAAPRAAGSGASPHAPALATVTAVRELHTPASDRSCVHVELDIGGADAATYAAGDHVGILPANDAATVAEVAALLGVDDLSTLVTFDPPTDAAAAADIGHPVPGPITLADALAWHADVLSPVAKPTVAAFARAAAGDEATALAALLAPDAAAAYKTWHAHARCLLEVMREFPATAKALGVGAFFGAVAPRLAVRFYSISSSPATSPTSLTVTAAVVRETTATGREHRGPASNGLAAAKPGDRVAFFIRRSTFRLPADPATPIIMIGPGTGLAPFRGFLQDRAATAAAGTQLGDSVLFFGCRSKKADYIYEDELKAFASAGALGTLHVAFSRDGKVKDYVQHHVAKHADTVKRLIAAGAYVYVCGDAKAMARDVHATLRDVLGGGATGDAALKALTDGGRYHKDVW